MKKNTKNIEALYERLKIVNGEKLFFREIYEIRGIQNSCFDRNNVDFSVKIVI